MTIGRDGHQLVKAVTFKLYFSLKTTVPRNPVVYCPEGLFVLVPRTLLCSGKKGSLYIYTYTTLNGGVIGVSQMRE